MEVFSTASYAPSELERIGQLIGFDAAQYCAAYPDVAKAAIDPLRHFLDQGVTENRLPAPGGMAALLGFDAAFYAASQPDAGADPLQHLLQTGLRQHRLPFPLAANAAAERLLWQVLDRRRIAHDGSLERQQRLAPLPWLGLAEELLAAASRTRLVCRPYRNNFWLGVGAGALAEGRFGIAATCYNFFFHGFAPMAALGNAVDRVVLTGRVVRTAEAVTRPATRRKAAGSTIVRIGEPCFLNRVGVLRPATEIGLAAPISGTLTDVELAAGTSVMVQSGHRILYDYLEPDSARPRELQSPCIVHAVGDACAVHWPARSQPVEEAFSLLHDHAHNYHHWLLEVLPRYLLARQLGLSADIPLLVETRLAPQKREILRRLFGAEPPLIELAADTAARVRRLHWTGDLCRNSVHTERSPQKDDIVFAPAAIALLRELAAPCLVPAAKPSRYDRVLILRRNVEFRRLINRGLFEEALREMDVWGFDPGQASWADQVRVFSAARLIVAEAGAALANIVFCRPGTTIVVLVNGHPHSNFFYLTQLAAMVDARLYFYECLRLGGSHAIEVQSDMVVPISRFMRQLRRFIEHPEPFRPAQRSLPRLVA